MVSLKDRLYRVEFGTSIAWLQAFAIGLAIIQGKNPTNNSGEPKGYIPYCPPLSPVGRA
ncbi:hypothetical protein BHE74_00014289 [Ensete ventricosum]|nr:hypothetical protein GW17_00040396 [Ensete ventricosum]RWW77549.1 hypothetical protein BHE74_00014289 [Ensete ventricosum]RZS14466.1 hypothetical protein BHM03_00046161 [Ensete ventricosum]